MVALEYWNLWFATVNAALTVANTRFTGDALVEPVKLTLQQLNQH
jgi:hypothetical protein